MTVESVHQDGRIFCHWFAGNKLEGGSFEPDAIDLEDNLDPLKKKKIAEWRKKAPRGQRPNDRHGPDAVTN